MRQTMPHVPVVDLTGETTLRETMGVLTHLSLFVGNDTGVNHIAASLGVPTVSLFGPTRADKWGHAGPTGIVLSAPEGDLSRLEVAPVVEAARLLLERCSDDARIPLGLSR
jgi:ADP-heptose:LPS heptosyltransferase